MPVILRAAPIPDELADHVALDATRGLGDDATVMRVRHRAGRQRRGSDPTRHVAPRRVG